VWRVSMTQIKPFRAVTYNQDKLKDITPLVCPPYDVISPTRQQYYHDLHQYNFIHILLGKDVPGEDKYSRAGEYFKAWLKDKVLVRDEAPAFYFYKQDYAVRGERKTRWGFIGLLKLDDKRSAAYGHELTHKAPKEDRLKLLRHVKANLSPIFVVSHDKKRIIQHVVHDLLQTKSPFIRITDDDKVVHTVWRVDEPEVIGEIQAKMSDENIFIADGHHRYEVACAFREEMKGNLGTITGEEDFNYVLAYFTNIDPKGLTILPIHRLVKCNAELSMDSFLPSVKEYFDVDEVKDKVRFLFLLEKAGNTEHVIGVYKDQRYWLFRLKNVKLLDKIISDRPKEYRLLDVAILNYFLIKGILGIEWNDSSSIFFSHPPEELIERVDRDNSSIAFFLNPVRVQQIIAIALAGEKMPQKSTFFYPKVLSGLVINKLNL
jgi:uncharacterized protein (DUF1015 family)